MTTPLIGLTSETIPPSQWTYDAGFAAPGQAFFCAAEDYICSVEKAGGTAVILPNTRNISEAREIWKKLDGFIVTGGNDVSPKLYGEKNEFCGELDELRDEYEFELIRYAIDARKPIWGICRGNQVLNVCMGGTLYQDLTHAGLKQHMIITPKTEREKPTHVDFIKEGTILHQILNVDAINVNSYHHQAIKTVGDGLEIQAISDDGIVESVAVIGHPFAISTQWHPEMMFDSDTMAMIFSAFIEAAREGGNDHV